MVKLALRQEEQLPKLFVTNLQHSAPVPEHWDQWESSEKHDTVQFAELPLPAGAPVADWIPHMNMGKTKPICSN